VITIQRARARVEEEKQDEASNPETNTDILRIQAEMEKLVDQAEVAGEQDNIDLAMVGHSHNAHHITLHCIGALHWCIALWQ
jgi:hypothetical protein